MVIEMEEIVYWVREFMPELSIVSPELNTGLRLV